MPQRQFRTQFQEFAADYETHYARRLGRSRLRRISRAEVFRLVLAITLAAEKAPDSAQQARLLLGIMMDGLRKGGAMR